MNYSLEFEIHELPKTTNAQASLHWRDKARETKRWHQMVWAVVGKRKPPVPLAKARLTLIRRSFEEPDFDGLVSGFKHVIDALVVIGVLADDKLSNIGQPKYEWQKHPRKQGKIQVTVEAIE